jgi:uncharacterized membrane protein YukC
MQNRRKSFRGSSYSTNEFITFIIINEKQVFVKANARFILSNFYAVIAAFHKYAQKKQARNVKLCV